MIDKEYDNRTEQEKKEAYMSLCNDALDDMVRAANNVEDKIRRFGYLFFG